MTQFHTRIKKLLIANRGEIALRIQRASKKLRIPSVTTVSEPDKDSLAARKAEEIVIIGPGPAKESYLAQEKVIDAAKATGCTAIHPGYGFLSENAEFAARVREAGLIFIGPTPEVIRLMGDKTAARAFAQKVGVPCAPGTPGGLSDDALIALAPGIGFPIMIKASAGGGGRGMRVVRTLEELKELLPRARGEVLKNFGSDSVFLEKYIDRPRHVEVQILADQHCNVIHLGTRDCSSQRRHQKLIEEAPAPNLSPKLREALHSAAVTLAKESGYTNAGTLEFLVSGKEFYFLEMNTRIQVEHPVTEEITGIDLVALQLRIAEGAPLPITQKRVKFKGHAIEFRINAEDPSQGFAPTRGQIKTLSHPKIRGYRREFAYNALDEVRLFYDGLIGKVVVWGRNRDAAIAKSIKILSRYVILGLPTSLDLERWVLENGEFRAGRLDIGFIEREFSPKCFNSHSIKSLGCDTGHTEKLVGREVRDADRTISDLEQGLTAYEYFKRALKNRDLWDPKHRKEDTTVEDKHCYEYQSKKFKTKYTIEVIHRNDGFFLAIPVDAKGRRGKRNSCRMSNGLSKVVSSVIADVLETTPPSEIFV